MEREIKFRAWDELEGKMLFSDINNDVNDDSREYYPFCFWVGYKSKKALKLMQYTGLKDKNGKEIYEGDIIEYTTCGLRLKAWIIFNEHIGCWQYQYKGAMAGTPSDFLYRLLSNTRFQAEVVVIGDLYSNP